MTGPMRWRMIGYMAALFIAGAITGAAVMARTAAGSQTLKVGRTDEIESRIKQRLQALDLTPQQWQKFDPLIKQTSQKLEASHLQCLQQCSAAVENMYAEIMPALTPEQQEKEKQLGAERRNSMREKYNFTPEAAQTGKP
jgi:Spy/CpxP family protein refolding chaperone